MGRGERCGCCGGKAVLREPALWGAGETARLRKGLLEERLSDKPTGEGWRSVGERDTQVSHGMPRHERHLADTSETARATGAATLLPPSRACLVCVWVGSAGASYWVLPFERPLCRIGGRCARDDTIGEHSQRLSRIPVAGRGFLVLL